MSIVSKERILATQIDRQTVFLYGKLEEHIFMRLFLRYAVVGMPTEEKPIGLEAGCIMY